jgi:hypothetical protein
MKKSRERDHLQAVGAQFDILQKSLKSLQRLRSELRKNSCWSHEHEARFGDLIIWTLDQMQSASFLAAATRARNLADVRIKAQIWLERYIPEDGDDVIELASSICADVVALRPHGELSDQEAHDPIGSRRQLYDEAFEASLDVVRKALQRMTSLDVPVEQVHPPGDGVT